MQKNRHYNYFHVLLIIMIMAFIGIGCTKEDRTLCSLPVMIEVKVNKTTIKELMFYVFDENESFIETIPAEIGSTVSLIYPNHNKLHLVCWGNSESGTQIMPTLEVGDKVENALVSVIIDNTKATQENVTIHPDNLFYTISDVTLSNEVNTTIELIIHPQTTPVKIVTPGLKERFGITNEEITYVLRSGKQNINFRGVITGEDVTHTQKAELKDGTHESPIFNILPNDKSVEVDIYNGATLLATIKNTDIATRGDTLNIYKTFKLGVGFLTVRAQTETRTDLDYLIDELKLYIFDEDRTFLGVQRGEIGSEIMLDYPSVDPRKLTVICWSNTDDIEHQIMPELVVGNIYDLDQLMVSVCSHTHSGGSKYVSNHLDDLFYAIKEVTLIPNVINAPVGMIITPKVARIEISAAENEGKDVHYVLRGKKQMGFNSGYIDPVPENRMIYTQLATFNGDNTHDAFNILPSKRAIEIDLYYGGVFHTTITTDKNGKTFNATQGQILDIDLILEDGERTIDVTITIRGWDGKLIDKDF